jgi:hypothetical protein
MQDNSNADTKAYIIIIIAYWVTNTAFVKDTIVFGIVSDFGIVISCVT